MANSSVMVECAFCLRKNEDMEKPKVLPCSHVHCYGCLVGYYDINGLLQCPQPCGKVFEGEINSLPSHTLASSTSKCDSCVARGDNNQAVVYCIQCDRKYCLNHKMSHDDALYDHKKMPMTEYMRKAESIKVRECDQHKGQPYTLGCRECFTLVCAKCFPVPATCKGVSGLPHTLQPLQILVQNVVTDNIRDKMVAKEKELDQQYKLISKVNEEYDSQTCEMVEMVNKRRKLQIEAINEQYDQLKKDVVTKRKEGKLQLMEIMEEKVLKMWTVLKNQRLKVESRLESSHQVDILKGYGDWQVEVNKALEIKLPEIKQLKIATLAESRKIELELVPSAEDLRVKGLVHAEEIQIDPQQERVYPPPMQRRVQMTIEHTYRLPSESNFAFFHKGVTYAVFRRKNEIAKIENNFQQSSSCKYKGEFLSAAADDQRLYLLIDLPEVPAESIFERSKPRRCEVHVYSLSKFSSGIELSIPVDVQYPIGWQNRLNLCVVSNYLLTIDGEKKLISVHSLHTSSYAPLGMKVKEISFLGDYVDQCAVDGNCLVLLTNNITNRWSQKISKVFKLDVSSGKVVWTRDLNASQNPMGVTRYMEQYLLVCSKESTLLDITTGETYLELSGSCPSYSASFNHLLVAVNSHHQSVGHAHHQLNYYRINLENPY